MLTIRALGTPSLTPPHGGARQNAPCQVAADSFRPGEISSEAVGPVLTRPRLVEAEPVQLTLDAAGKPKTLSGDDFGDASPVHCRLADGSAGVLKLEKPKNMCEQKRLEAWWTHQIVSSDIMRHMGCHTVHYREARADFQGETLQGVACELADIRELAHNEQLLPGLKNADQAILGTVVCAWLGDFDRSIKNENIWIDSGQQVLYGDYGCAGMEHVNAFGVMPKVNRTLFASLGTPHNVKAALDRVRGLSDEDIETMVHHGARLVPSASPKVLQEMTHTLIGNRDQLRADPQWGLDLIGPDQRQSYPMPEKIAAALMERIQQKFSQPGRCPNEIAQAALEGVPGYAPEKGKDHELVQLQLANAIHRCQQSQPGQLEIVPRCFYVWMQLAKKIFTEKESLELGLGLKHR